MNEIDYGTECVPTPLREQHFNISDLETHSTLPGSDISLQPDDEYETYKPFHADIDQLDLNEEEDDTQSDEDNDREEKEDFDMERKYDTEQTEDGYESLIPIRNFNPNDRPYSSRPAKRQKREEYCYLCYFGQHASEIENNKNHSNLLRYMTEAYHQLSVYVYTRNIQEFYNSFLRGDVELLASENGYKKLIWRKRTIYEHVSKHTFSVAIAMQDAVMTFREVMDIERDNGIFLRHKKTGKCTIDRKSLNGYILTFKQQLLAMKQLYRPNATI